MFHFHSEYFPYAENQNYVFCSTAFADKIIGENIVYRLFYQLVVNMGKYLPQKGKVRENTSCLTALVIFADLSLFRQIFPHITRGTSYFRGPFPFSANISPY